MVHRAPDCQGAWWAWSQGVIWGTGTEPCAWCRGEGAQATLGQWALPCICPTETQANMKNYNTEKSCSPAGEPGNTAGRKTFRNFRLNVEWGKVYPAAWSCQASPGPGSGEVRARLPQSPLALPSPSPAPCQLGVMQGKAKC